MIGSNRPAHKSSTAFLMALVLSSTALTSVALTTGASANDLPSGATVTAGSVDIQSKADGLLINQATQNAIINWHDFSVGRDRSVHFNNGSGATLNRVTGPHISRIDGSLSATGSLYLVNQHGIVIGKDGVVKTGGSFVASTLDISDEDFLDGGNLTFKGDANTKIINQGKVGSLGGDVAFISRHIVNEGSISAPNGSVGLAVGREVLLQDAELDDGKFLVKVGDADSSITEAGVIDAASVELRAHGGNIYALAGNKGGAINASGTSRSGGRIFLTAGGGKVSVKKTLRAKSRRVRTASKARSSIYINADVVNLAGLLDVSNEEGLGGKIDVGGNVISLTGATLNADGSQGGGDIRVGGAYQGGDFGDLTTATILSVDDQTLLTASATDAGDGGDIVLWSDELTSFAGRIEAKGKKDGKGGDAEVSGKAKLAYLGFADLTSESGVFGTLLLDPYNVTLSNEPDFNSSGLAAAGDDSNINITTLQNQLASANVTITTTNAAGTQSGDILVADDITWGADTILTLNADRNIGFFANVTATGTSAGLALNHGAGGDYIIADGASIDLTGSNSSFSLNGQSYTLIRSMAELDNIDNTGLGGRYALATDLDAAGTTYTQALVGHHSGFSGVFAGLGNEISNLAIDGNGLATGLFGRVGGATVRDISLEGGTIKGTYQVGGLAGSVGVTIVGGVTTYGTISNARSSASVSSTGSHYVGGLVGQNAFGTIKNSQSSGSVTSTGATVGGLAGSNSGTILNSYATGSVSGTENIGGLVGINGTVLGGPGSSSGTITNSYATGDVTATITNAGGLVGRHQDGTIQNSYSTGSVTGPTRIGGLVGLNWDGTITNAYASGAVSGTSRTAGFVGHAVGNSNISSSYWDRQTTGQSSAVGAISGSGSSHSITRLTTSQARNSGNYSGFNFTNDWYQNADMRPILRAESGPTINGVTAVSNLNQLALMGSNLSDNYVLTKDINASATDGSNPSGIWSPSGWVPVGLFPNPYSGTFDGNKHSIDNLSASRNLQVAGLFGNVQSATFRNISLKNANIESTRQGQVFVGGLLGYGLSTTIQNTSVNGTIKGSGGQTMIGGIAGRLSNTNISNSFATGSVEADSNVLNVTSNREASSFAGGLVGYYNGGSVSTSYADVAVSAKSTISGSGTNTYITAASTAGGLLGWSTANVTDAYATGNITTSAIALPGVQSVNARTVTRLGGLIGLRYSGTLNRTYAAGSLTYSHQNSDNNDVVDIAGLVGRNWFSAPLLNSYWDTDKTGQTIAYTGAVPGSFSATGLTTAQFQDTDAFMTQAGNQGWNFNTTWSPSSLGYYPELYAVNPVIWANDVTTSSTYGQSTSTVTAVTSHGGPASYVFGRSPDAVTLTGGTVAVDPTTNAGTTNGSLVSQNVSQNSDQGQRYRIFYHGDTTRNVAKADLTITASNDSKTYGTLAPLTNFTTSGLVNSDGVTGLSLTSTGAPVSATVGDYDILASNATGMGLDNYNITYVNGTLTVAKAPLAIYVDNASKTYGNAADPFSYTASGLVAANGDNITSLDLASLGAPATANAGTYAITADNAAGNGLGNYQIAYVPGTLTVNKADLTIAANDASKTYGNAAAPFGYTQSGLVNSDNITSVSLASLGAPATANAGTYAITANNALGNRLGNYNISYVDGILTVNKAPLTITASNASKTYGNAAAPFGYTSSGLVNSDNISSVSLASLGAPATADAGTYAITADNAAGNGLGNYDINYVNGTLTVNKANLTVTASNDSKTYGTLASLTGFTTSGLVNSDSVTGLSLTSTGSPVSANVGTYDIVASNANGIGLENYNINYVKGTLTVAKAPLAIYASNDSKIYGTLANLTGYTSSGLVTANGDSITSVDLASNGSPVSAHVSSYYIDASNAQGNGLDNYDISYVRGILTVNPADLTITANDASKTYGSVFTPTGYTVNGLVTANGDSITSLDLSTSGGAARADVGSYDILASNAQGTGLSFDGVSNYTITYVKGNLDVTKKPLTITGSNVTKTYGDTAPNLGSLSYPGLVAGDSLSYTLSSNGQVNTANVGTYDIDAALSGTSGLGNNPLSHNYDITLQKGQLTVNPRAITVTALGGNSIYGDVPTNPGLGATNLASFDSVSALTGLSNSFGISGTTNAGTYTTQVAGTLSNNNYTITQRVDGTWTVNRRPIYIFPHNQYRQYGAPNPTLTYDVGFRGLVNGDVLNGSLDTPANVTSPVGQYAITAGTLTNANNPNYDISVESFGSNERPVFLHVTPAPLTITASDATKYLGQYFQPTGYTVAGLLNMDSVDALTLFSAGSPVSAPLGNYDIVPSAASGQGLSNYSITYVNGRLTVQDAPGEVEPPRITMTSILPLTACQDRFDKDGVVLNEDGTFARIQRFDCETDMAFDEVPKFN